MHYPISVLGNGVKIVTSPHPCHFAGVGAYLKAGSRFETAPLRGLSHLMDRLAFKSTTEHSQAEIEQQLLSLGGNYQCESSRETVLYQASTFHRDIEKMVKLMSETICTPRLLPEEVQAETFNAKFELEEVSRNPDLLLPELAHQAAFKNGLGNPLMAPADRLEQITPAQLWQYRELLFKPSRLTLSFVGLPHERSVELAERYFGSFSDGQLSLAASESLPKLDTERSQYVGGEICTDLPPPLPNLPEFHHCQVLFRAPGVNDKDVYATATLQTLLGGGGSFSAGGPGKGMYSRLYTHVLNQYGYVESCQAVNHSYSDDGLFGITCASIPEAAQYIPYIIGSQLAMLFTPNTLSKTEVERAKNQLRSQLLMNLESRMVEMEDAGRQVEMNGRKMDVDEMISSIEGLTVKDLQTVAKKICTGSRPTVVMMGERESFGDVRKVLADFGLGTR